MQARRLAAVEVVTKRAFQARVADRDRLQEVLGVPIDFEAELQLLSEVRRHSRITLNFHPDRVDQDGNSVAEGMLKTGRYRPQSETGISNGGRSAVPGGDRTRWEQLLFDAVYDNDQDHTDVKSRPVYGSLDVTRDPHGGSPRFGSSYVVLEDACFDRSTFCVGDSHSGPVDVGTVDCFAGVLAGLFEQGVAGEGLDRSLTVEDLRRIIADCGRAPLPAQIHGGVAIGNDVSEIILDPSFAQTRVADRVRQASERFGFGLRFHCGSELLVDEVPNDFRGPTMRALAALVAGDRGIVDAATIGRMANLVPFTPPTPQGDPPESRRQQYKYLWHCLLRFGRDAKG